ncbi:Mariner Mos1 transposase [Eumeta japonica]|uniref:Mariner Mos1 transposase n=1 Tax=Eumeta variegata TaxID=151549 RepID=A0A4C1VHU3_EUMVA|nr:Mariner Mos1 transposase [Eumeta japonica]
MGKTAAESHRILLGVYDEHALAEQTCRKWFARFKSGDFELDDKEQPGPPKKFEDEELQGLLDIDLCQTLQELATSLAVDLSMAGKRLKTMGIIQKQGYWVPYKLKLRDIDRRFLTCELLLERQKRKGFLHQIVTGDEKWIHYDNPKRSHGKRHDKVFLLHDNARPHVAKPVKTYLGTLKWDVLPHPPYSPDIAPSDYHLFRSMAHGLTDQKFTSYEDYQKWVDLWISSYSSLARKMAESSRKRWEIF